MQNTDAPDDMTITQRFAAKLTQLGITSEVVGDDLTVTVEGVQIGAHIDDYTPFGEMWRLYLSVDVGEVDDAAAAAAAEVVQSVVAMYGRRLLKGADDLLLLLDRHGETLCNAEPENPKWEEVQHDGVIRGWDIWVADGQVCAFVPYLPHSTGEVSDGGPLTDWRDAICAAGRLMLQARERIIGAEKRVAELEAENARLLAELEKPVLAAWDRVGGGWVRAGTWAAGCSVGKRSVVAVDTYFRPGWQMFDGDKVIASGAETGDAGRHAADLTAALAYRLIGGVHPAPDVVPNG